MSTRFMFHDDTHINNYNLRILEDRLTYFVTRFMFHDGFISCHLFNTQLIKNHFEDLLYIATVCFTKIIVFTTLYVL